MKYQMYKFQQDAIRELLGGKHIIIAQTGCGKSAIAMKFVEQQAERTGKRKFLVVTTTSKTKARNSNGDDDFTADARVFCSSSFSDSLSSSLSLISWHKLRAWVDANWRSLDEYIYIFDEVAKCAGYSTGMGRAFLKITKRTTDWAGFTATPGDSWDKFISYFVATGQTRNKTSFMHEFANVQTFKGYPEIVGWRNEDKLKAMWSNISYAPDTKKVLQELPGERHSVVSFKKPSTYGKVLKTRQNASGDLLDTSGALTSELRRLCFTKDKQQWVADFVETLGTGAVMFYNFVKTGDELERIITKALPKGARVWRIDGKHHEIPTAETSGDRDIVLCQWQSGSEGLNLQHLHTWVSVEPCYAYSTSIQARGRIKRIAQENFMQFYYLKCDDCIESDIYDVLKNKGTFAERNWLAGKGITLKEG